MSVGGVVWRVLAAFVLAPPLALGVLALLAFVADREAFNVVDPECIAFLIAFVGLSLPGLLLAIIIGWHSSSLLAEFGARIATTITVGIASIAAAAFWVVALFAVGIGLDFAPVALLLPMLEGAIAGGILMGLTAPWMNKATEDA